MFPILNPNAFILDFPWSTQTKEILRQKRASIVDEKRIKKRVHLCCIKWTHMKLWSETSNRVCVFFIRWQNFHPVEERNSWRISLRVNFWARTMNHNGRNKKIYITRTKWASRNERKKTHQLKRASTNGIIFSDRMRSTKKQIRL